MKMVSTADLYNRPVIVYIKTVNKNHNRSKYKVEQTQLLEHGVINGTGRLQAKNEFNT